MRQISCRVSLKSAGRQSLVQVAWISNTYLLTRMLRRSLASISCPLLLSRQALLGSVLCCPWRSHLSPVSVLRTTQRRSNRRRPARLPVFRLSLAALRSAPIVLCPTAGDGNEAGQLQS